MKRRLRIAIRGAVQGVGFRPFVYQVAHDLGLAGWVINGPDGVVIEAEGPSDHLDALLARLSAEAPSAAVVKRIESVEIPPQGEATFAIRTSAHGPPTALVLPDLAVCADCRRELLDPADRRHRHPFLTCTRCGPRFSILLRIPYDRPHTTMAGFPMCDACRAEYTDPRNRRHHAQPIACPDCGPTLTWRGSGTEARCEDALASAERTLREGGIVAVKGIGGYHLMADARDSAAVARLRERKLREEKPLAVMAPDLDWVRKMARVGPEEARLLTSAAAPIVLVAKRPDTTGSLAEAVAPGRPEWGLMLPYSPLHALLLHDLGFPLVATSGNRSEEPLCTDPGEAEARLADIADGWLHHDRPIARAVEDSVVRVILGRPQILRRARGYAPLPVDVAFDLPPTLAVGGHLKNTVALARGGQVVVGPHLGDLEHPSAREAFVRAAADLADLTGIAPERIARDAHPDYASSLWAMERPLPGYAVQHHLAHVLSCLAENQAQPPALGVAWDGTGYGTDSTIWGGEWFRIDADGCHRVAWLKPFPLPGGDAGIRDPRRAALGLVHAALGAEAAVALASDLGFAPEEARVLPEMLRRGVNAPRCSSMGRLFDAVAALLGLCRRSTFEGQAAMTVEAAAAPGDLDLPPLAPDGSGALDPSGLLKALLDARDRGEPAPALAHAFHRALATTLVEVARAQALPRVALSGGCFQNRLLTELTADALADAGFEALIHRQVPPNDGGLSLGQAVAPASCGEPHLSCGLTPPPAPPSPTASRPRPR